MHPTQVLAQASCVIFDFDGVIADSEEFQLQVWGEVLASRGIQPAEFSVHTIAGLLDRESIKNLCPRGSEQDHAELVALKAQACRDRETEIERVPCICQVLESLAGHQKRFVCSSSAPDLIRGFLGRQLSHIQFDGVIGAGDYASFKPHPEPYLTVLKIAGVTADQAIAIEDSPTGVRSAQAANIRVIHFDRYRMGAKSEMVVHSLHELRQ